MKKFDTCKGIFEMSQEEQKIDGWAAALNIEYIAELIRNSRAVKFKREMPDSESYIIVSSDMDPDDTKYRVTFFDKHGPASHRSYHRPIEAARAVHDSIPTRQAYMLPEEVL